MTLFCSATGIKAHSSSEWVNQKVSETFEANFWTIGDSIIYSLPKGFADLQGVRNSLALNDKVTASVSRGSGPYIQIEDYSLVKGTSFEARKYFTKKINGIDRPFSLIFCNANLPLSIAIKLARRFNTTDKHIYAVKNYRTAVNKALELRGQKPLKADSIPLDICQCYDNGGCSFSPVEILSNNSWKRQTPKFSNQSMVVDQCVFHSCSKGYLESRHVPLIENIRHQCLSDLPENSTIQYMITDYAQVKGASRSARAEYMKDLKNWHQHFPFKMYIVYNANTFTKTALHLARPLMPFQVKIAKDMKHAFQLVRQDKDKSLVEPPMERTKNISPDVSQKDLEKLFALIGSLNWETTGTTQNFDMAPEHPFYFLFQSIKLIKEELDDLLQKREKGISDLRESEKKYRQLFKHAPAGMFEFDLTKNRFTSVNEVMCAYSGYSEKEFLAMNPLDLLTEKSRALFIKRFADLELDKKMSNTVEYHIVKKNKEKLCVLLNNDFIYENGQLTGARVVAHDITQLKQAEEEKINAQKIAGEQKKLALVGQIAGKMAHDFNNILGIIMGNAELALLDCLDIETKETLALILEQTFRGKNLTKNLVAFARDQEPKQEFFRINEKIDLVLSLLKKDLTGIELVKEDKPGVPDLLADPGMIEHALVNLIQNSIHATSRVEHPKIILHTYCLDDNICLEIQDNGCGIPKEHLEKIYEPSFTLKGSKDVTGSYESGIKGTGYGMSNVKKYIKQHKGTIRIESEMGSGSKFTIHLPVIKKELTRQEKTAIQKEKPYFDKSILLVEDEQAISGVQYRILSQEPCNHRVDIANDGLVALDLFSRNKYDLISLDYILPGKITGMDVYTHIRKTDKTIPILFISGNIEFLESIKELKQKDAHIEHLSKPCQNKEYINGINRLFNKTCAEQQ